MNFGKCCDNKTPMTALLSKAACVIDFKDWKVESVGALFPSLKAYLDTYGNLYGYALHDRDTLEDGTLKTLHLHLIFTLKKRTRKSTIINALAKTTGVNPLAVSVQKATSFEGCMQYLIHLNDSDKFQYSREDLVTNLEPEELEMVLTSNTTGLDYSTVRSICLTANSLLDVIEQVGISTYQHYRSSIIDIFTMTQEEKRHV